MFTAFASSAAQRHTGAQIAVAVDRQLRRRNDATLSNELAQEAQNEIKARTTTLSDGVLALRSNASSGDGTGFDNGPQKQMSIKSSPRVLRSERFLRKGHHCSVRRVVAEQ